jgi:hypothetical protein
MVPDAGERRACKQHQQQSGSKQLLHAINPAGVEALEQTQTPPHHERNGT